MAKLKTTPNDLDVDSFLQTVENEKKQQDSYTILELMKEVTGAEPPMWGPSIIGFGHYHCEYNLSLRVEASEIDP